MEDYRLEQSGQEVQDIMNGAAMQVDLTAENERAELAEQTLQGKIDDEETRAKAAEKQNADDIDALEEKVPSGASSSNKLATEEYVENSVSTKQDTLTFDNVPTEGSNNPVKSGGVYSADKALSDAIEAILLLIPSAATSLNKLADKAFVNSSIATASATFRGTYNLVTDLSLTVSATHAQIATALAGAVSDEDNNDYAFVQIPTSDATPTQIAKTERYKFNGMAWEYEYDLNNSGYTAAQWAAINSGITEALVTKLSVLPTNTELTTALGVLTSSITTINQKIPSAASQANQLVDIAAMESYIVQVLDVLTASFNVTSSDGHVTVQISQVDGKITSVSVSTSDIASAASLSLIAGRVTTAEGNISTNAADIANLQDAYAALTQSALVVVQPTDTWPVASPATSTIYRVVDRTNTPPQYYSDYMWNGTAMVLMATYDNAIDDVPTAGSNNLVKSGGVYNELALGAVYDVSAKNPTAGPNNDGKWESLSALFSDANLSTLIPTSVRKGGMSIKFVQSSDNKYVQFRLKTQTFSINVTDWQCEDAIDVTGSEKDEVSIVDKNNYAILRLLSYLLVDKNGNIRTKGFNSAEQAIIGNALAVLSEKFANTFPGGTSSDFSVEDENQNAILRLLSYLYIDGDGIIKTKSFDSSLIKSVKDNQDTLSLADDLGNAILKINNKGQIKTKSFDSSKFIVVDINGKGDYTSLEDAINNAGDSYNDNIDKTIIVMPGTYQMTEIATSSTAEKFGHRSLNIIGINREKCIIVGSNGYYASGSEEGAPGFADSAPLKLSGNCYVANLTIISNDDNFQMQEGDTGNPDLRHTAYCIHIDYPNYGRWKFHVDNCILKNDHYACIGCGLRGELIVTNCIMECSMYNPNQIRGCVYAHDSGQIDVPGPYDVVEALVKDCILTGKSGAPLTFYAPFHKTMHLTFVNNVVFNDAGGDVLVMNSTYQDKTKYCFGNNNSELNYNV